MQLPGGGARIRSAAHMREDCCDWKLPANCSHGAGVDKLLNIKRCPVASGTAASQERD